MFQPARALKERRWPHSPVLGSLKTPTPPVFHRRRSRRILTTILMISTCIIVGFFVHQSRTRSFRLAQPVWDEAAPEAGSSHVKLRAVDNSDQMALTDNGDSVLPGASLPAKDDYNTHSAIPSAEPSMPVMPTLPPRPSFELNFLRVLDLLPDEIRHQELIRPVASTGKLRMREMGLRTRAYKTYFTAWEALHLDHEDETYIHNDIPQYLRQHHPGGLGGLSLAQTLRSYEGFRSFIIAMAELLFPWTMPYFGDHMSLHAHIKNGGRGIVLTAGNGQAPYLLTTIYSFRKLGCTLPIEIMYLGDEDLGQDYIAELEGLDGVVTRDMAVMVRDDGWKLRGWAAKPFAILLSSFREVVFIDADSLFFRDPALLFDDDDYREKGALFFRDRLFLPEKKAPFLQAILQKPIPKAATESRMWTGESGHQQESGVIVVDKSRHFIPMLLVTRMNGPDRDGNKEEGRVGVYELVYGDKETFWLGWLLAGDEDYAFHKGEAAIMGAAYQYGDDLPEEVREECEKSETDPDAKSYPLECEIADRDGKPQALICASQLLHLDTEGKPLWLNGWLLENKFKGPESGFAKFESYLVEPADATLRKPGSWKLYKGNRFCMLGDADKKFDFTLEETTALEMIVERAREVNRRWR
ncbi:putative alpha-1,3-mannosyltransferase MNN14 [Colletotrichum tanaceti]|uniref:Putative alpha-1,3-mannosyltransferase MNN14 n=1 Tax=Colletotrichum tanaceti TaxID=1306861 RepID=A0A4U6XHU1_9PEZI|nr:putative alpha-1,3-mannosyltransferase MNN14 [Colletotrichum tanaceti]TKW55113.1 putative alpha-1,3-mannosyltransferase MNN14 [Colletotrichum tanaceti]